MNIMKRVGFFKELTHGNKNATSIKEIIGQNTLDKEPEIMEKFFVLHQGWFAMCWMNIKV